MILLDTHIVVWAVDDDPRLGMKARAILERDTDRRVSTIIAWEMAMLARKGHLTFNMPLDAWLARSLGNIDAHDVPVSRMIAHDAGALADDIHGDPCDRIMIATARRLGCPLLTADRKILAYAAAGHLKAIDARV